LGEHRVQLSGDLLLALAAGPARVVATVASTRRFLELASLAHDVLDQLPDTARRARVFLLNLLRHHGGARLQGAGDDLDRAHDRLEPAVQLAAARDLVGERRGDRAEMLDQPTQRTRIVA